MRLSWLRRARRAWARLAGPAPRALSGAAAGVRWQVYLPPAGQAWDHGSVLHFLHPAQADHLSWGERRLARLFYARLLELRRPAPTVISVSYGRVWTLMDTRARRGPTAGSYLSLAVGRIEAGLGAPVRRRLLWGISQGGFNGARLLLREPRLFDAVVLSSPALMPVALYDDAEIETYIRRSRAHGPTVWWGVERLRARVAGPEAWLREDPLAMAPACRALPPLLVQAAADDEFGFWHGARELCKALEGLRPEPVLRLRPGSHASLDVAEAADFLSQETPCAAAARGLS